MAAIPIVRTNNQSSLIGACHKVRENYSTKYESEVKRSKLRNERYVDNDSEHAKITNTAMEGDSRGFYFFYSEKEAQGSKSRNSVLLRSRH